MVATTTRRRTTSLVIGSVLVAQRAHTAGQLGQLERGPAPHVDVRSHERRDAGDILVADVEPVRPQLVHRGVDVPRVEEDDSVEDQAERAELVLHAVLVALVELPRAAVEDLPGGVRGGPPGAWPPP